MDWLVKKSKKDSVVVKLPQNISDEISIDVNIGEKRGLYLSQTRGSHP